MQRISLAPVLSATFSRDSCWITSLSPQPSLGLLEDLHDAPALGRRQRTGLHDQDAVADAAGVLLVVRLELRRTPHDLAVQRVLHAVLDGHDHGLVHLVADHEALADLATGPLGRAHRVVAHAPNSSDSVFVPPGTVRMPSSRSRTTV